MRASWDQTWMQVAEVIAHRSLCVRDQVGCVIVDGHNRIVSTGYNGPPAHFPHRNAPCQEWCQRAMNGPTSETMRSYVDCPSLHAEQNALSVCDRSMRDGGAIYVTGPVCWACARLIANSGLIRLVVYADGTRDYRGPDHSYSLLRDCGIAVSTMLPVG